MANGALTYNVPLESMKGINNFQPNLSIAYNSQNGNGAAGWGWNLVGLSTISRGGKSKEIDGATIGVQFNDNDPYYLDGQRLLQNNSTEYVTKNFSTIKITKSTGDYSFVVRYTDGKIAYYKELVSGQNYIVKMADAFNNEIHYSYTVESNSPRIDKISYGGSDALSDKFYLNISYASRHKPIKIYRNSQQFISGKVISEIISGSTYTGDYRKYTFSYDFIEGGNIERLRTIMVFNEIGESLKPLNFNYNSANSTGTALTTKRQLATVPANTWKLNDVSAGNFYDSGETDTFFITTTVNDFRSGPNGPVNGAPETPPGSLRNPIFYLNGPFGPVPPSTYVDAHTRLFTGKTLINNNKITANDQLIIVNTRSKTSVSEQGIIEIKDFKTGVTKILNGGPSIPWGSTYQGSLRISHKMLIPGDFDNDGLFDFIHVQGNIQGSQKIYLYEVGKETTNTITRKEFVTTNLFLTEDNFRLLELDGDGIPEIMVNSGNQYAFYKINTVDLTIKPFGDLLGQSSSNILHDLSYDENGKLITPFLMGDFNGDGLTDFVTPRKVFGNVNPFSKLRAYIENEDPNSFKWWLYTSDGKKFIPTELDLSAQKLAYIKPSADDSVAPKQSSWDLFLWGQDQQGAKEYAVANVIVTDINNDGKSDLVSVSRFGRIKYNDPNPLISNTTWENVSDVYTEFIYDRGCFNQIGGAIPATYDIYSHSWKCTDPNFPTLISPTTTSNGHLTIPVPYVTILPNFNKIKFYLNTSEGNSFQKLNQEVDIQTEKITPFSLFLTSNNVNFLNSYRSSISNFDVTTGTELKITFNNDNFLEKQIQEVNNGSTVLQKIEYRPMIQLDSNEEVSYQYKENDLTYPLYVHKTNGSLYLVNKIHTLFGGKILTKEYRFENAIQSLDGKGFLGFQKNYSSDAYESILQNGKYRNKKLVNALFWTVNTRDAQMDNALVTKTYGGLTKFLTQSTLTNHKYVNGIRQMKIQILKSSINTIIPLNFRKRFMVQIMVRVSLTQQNMINISE